VIHFPVPIFSHVANGDALDAVRLAPDAQREVAENPFYLLDGVLGFPDINDDPGLLRARRAPALLGSSATYLPASRTCTGEIYLESLQ
jgi:hypothetical protein